MRIIATIFGRRSYSTGKLSTTSQLIDNLDLERIEKNIILRKHNNNVPVLRQLLNSFREGSNNVLKELESEALKLPNDTHPRLLKYGSEPKVMATYFPQYTSWENASEFSEIAKGLNIFRMDHLGNYTGHKSYFLMGKLAEAEQAIRNYAIKELLKNGFKILSVPDMLPREIIEGCGMQTNSERNQVYKLDSGMCLSGTSEMSIAGYFANKVFSLNQLPIKVAAVSRCYRAETSGLHEEKGIYRVHQFTKVEMFSICSQNQSEELIEHFKNIQIQLFKNLNLKIQLLDMPPTDLGAPAYQKYDIETWMPGRKMWGEISSCSNCTDYQAKRLSIKYTTNENELLLAHTVNGTAAAIPRLLISIIESNQVDKTAIKLPFSLVDYMQNDLICKEKIFRN